VDYVLITIIGAGFLLMSISDFGIGRK